MQEEKFWLLLSLNLSGEATPEEHEALRTILRENPGLGLQVEMLNQMWKENKHGEKSTDLFFNRHLQRLSHYPKDSKEQVPVSQPVLYPEDIKAGKGKKIKWLWLASYAAAASLLLFFVVFYKWESNADKQKDQVTAQNTISTRRGSKSKIQLPDGTMVWLNADSKVIYDENFRGDFREVHLEGEAFFDVVKDKARPFIIHTKTIDVKVLGTAFNVRSYQNESNTETALFRGSVEITLRDSPDKKIILKPNEKIKIPNKTTEVTENSDASSIAKKDDQDALTITVSKVHFQEKDSSALDVLWVKNKLVFDAETLELVAKKIERWYDVKVMIENDDLREVTYSAIFDNENIEQVMEALRITGDFRYTINKDTVTIW